MSATATRSRRGSNGRYASRHATCEGCGNYLAENLLGQLRCLRRRCDRYRQVIDTVPGVDVGLLAEALG